MSVITSKKSPLAAFWHRRRSQKNKAAVARHSTRTLPSYLELEQSILQAGARWQASSQARSLQKQRGHSKTLPSDLKLEHCVTKDVAAQPETPTEINNTPMPTEEQKFFVNSITYIKTTKIPNYYFIKCHTVNNGQIRQTCVLPDQTQTHTHSQRCCL